MSKCYSSKECKDGLIYNHNICRETFGKIQISLIILIILIPEIRSTLQRPLEISQHTDVWKDLEDVRIPTFTVIIQPSTEVLSWKSGKI